MDRENYFTFAERWTDRHDSNASCINFFPDAQKILNSMATRIAPICKPLKATAQTKACKRVQFFQRTNKKINYCFNKEYYEKNSTY